MSRLTTSPFGGLRGLTNSRIDLQRRMKYEEVTQRFFKKCNFTKLSSTSLFLIFTFLLLISLATKALRHKEPRRFFYFRNENFPLRGAATSLFLIFTFLLFIFLSSKAPRHEKPLSFINKNA